MPNQMPYMIPHSVMASIIYWEQEGWNRQLAPSIGDKVFWYKRIGKIKMAFNISRKDLHNDNILFQFLCKGTKRHATNFYQTYQMRGLPFFALPWLLLLPFAWPPIASQLLACSFSERYFAPDLA